jgi:propanol-preferring alcohol dehydrogenase
MRAMVLTSQGRIGKRRLQAADVERPEPGRGQVLVKVLANAVCRTDVHVIEGDLTEPKLPLIPGHQIVGVVEGMGEGVRGVELGARVGIPWLGDVCGRCAYCRSSRENLCDNPGFTGYQLDGGYAEYAVARADFAFPIPEQYDDVAAAPLLCAGLIGHRALRLARVVGLGGVGRLGIYGFGSSAHIVIQVARHLGYDVYVVTRAPQGQEFARELGALWTGGPDRLPPVKLDSAIVFAPVGEVVPQALRAVRKDGVVLCAGIHMTPIPELDYELLWGERTLRSVANLTRTDGLEFLELAPKVPVEVQTEVFPLEEANEALARVKAGKVHGAAVLVP